MSRHGATRATKACGLEQAAYPLAVGFLGYNRELWNSRILAKLHNQYVRHQACTDMSDPALLTLAVLKVTETGALEGRRAAFECRGTSSLTHPFGSSPSLLGNDS